MLKKRRQRKQMDPPKKKTLRVAVGARMHLTLHSNRL